MKFNKLLVSALAALTLVACNKDENVSQEVQPERGETTRARITLTQAAPVAYAHYGNLTPTAEEAAIKTATIYIFDNTRVLEKEETLTLTTGATSSMSSAFEITTGQKYFYVAINVTPATTFTPNVTTMTDVQNEILSVTSIAAATDGSASGPGFWMTSMQEVSETLVAASATDTDPSGAAVNNVSITVGRAVAKVGVQYDETTAVQQSAGKLTQVKYKVHNNPNRMYLIPGYDNVNGLLKTPFYNATSILAANYFANATYLDAGLDSSNEYENPSYMMENSNQVPAAGNATYLMIRGVYTPDMVYDKDGLNPRAGVVGDNFYRIQRANGSYTDKFYYEDPDAAVLIAEGGTGAGSVLYTNGEAYYGLWLKDNTKSSPACYAIPRNTYFGVTITSVSGPGESNEGKVVPDPDDKLDEDTYMRAEITVLNWSPVEQSGGI